MKNVYLSLFSRSYFDGDDDADAKAKADADAKAAADALKPTLTQDQFDKAVAEERRKQEQKIKSLTDQLTNLQKSQGLTSKEKAEIQTQLDDLKNQSLTKEQVLLRDQENLKKKYDTDIADRDEKSKGWETRHHRLLISQSITHAAATNDAFRPEQLLDLLKDKAKIVEKKDDDGMPTGEFQVLFSFTDTDAKTKKPIHVDLEADAMMKRMKELPDQYGNLFKSTMNAGTGGTNSNGRKSGTPDIKAQTPEEYRALRAERQKTQGY